MKRRDFVAFCASTMCGWSLPSRAEQGVPQIGFLHGESPARFGGFLDLVRQGLGESGFVEGKNVLIEYRWGGRPKR